MKLLRNLGGALSLALLLGLVVSSVPAGAQTLTGLALERTVTLAGILTTVTPTIDPGVLAALASGALEIREKVTYNASQNTLTSIFFLVPAGSPNPTDLTLLPFNAFAGTIVTAVDKIYFNSKPTTAVTLVGNVVQGTQTAYGSALGGVSTFSFGYSSDKLPKISNVIETNAGYIVIYSASSQGTVAITQPAGGGGGSSSGISITVNGSTSATPTFQTVTNLVTLDASKTTSTNAGSLSFSWVVAQGSPSATINNAKSSKADIQLDSGHGTYIITLTVTDSAGSKSINIIIQFV